MLATIIAISIIILLVCSWFTLIPKKLMQLENNLNDVIIQIDMQVSSRFGGLNVLFEILNNSNKLEIENFIKNINNNKPNINSKLSLANLKEQETFISNTIYELSNMCNKYPEIISNKRYIDTLHSIQHFENMIKTSILIYNSNVTTFNKEINKTYTNIFCKLLGFNKKEYF